MAHVLLLNVVSAAALLRPLPPAPSRQLRLPRPALHCSTPQQLGAAGASAGVSLAALRMSATQDIQMSASTQGIAKPQGNASLANPNNITTKPLPLRPKVADSALYDKNPIRPCSLDDPCGITDTQARYAARDWGHNLWTMPQSRILRRIISPLRYVMAMTFVSLYAHRVHGPLPPLTTAPHTLLGSALGLLLVFRTNTAYDRYWEARKRWGQMVDECRTFASLACVFLQLGSASRLLYLIAAFPWVLKNHLRCERDTRPLKALLPKEERHALQQHRNQPQYLLARMRAAAHAARREGLNDKEREMLMKCASTLNECVGACERIVQTPIPLHYSRHTSRFVLLYCLSLPIALVNALDWVIVPTMFVLAWALFGILEIGYLIEEPFSRETDDDGQQLLPLNQLCRTVRQDVRALYNLTATGALNRPLPIRIDKIG